MAMIVLTSACMYGWILRAVGLWFLLMFFVYNCFGEDMMEEVFIRQENGVVWFFEDSWPWLLLLSGILFIPLLLKKMGFGTK